MAWSYTGPFSDGTGGGVVICSCWAPELGLFLVGGFSFDTPTTAVSPTGQDGTWTLDTATEWGQTNAVCWSPELGLFVALSQNFGDPNDCIATSTDGVHWTNLHVNPWNVADSEGTGFGVCWSPELHLFVAVGSDFDTNAVEIITSPDGVVWTVRSGTGDGLFLDGGSCVCWSPDLGLFLAGGQSGDPNPVVATSPDGITWTPRASTFDGPGFAEALGACWSPELGLFCVVGNDALGAATAMTSPNGITWTNRGLVFGPSPFGQNGFGVCWSPERGEFLAVGRSTGTTHCDTAISKDGTNWQQGIKSVMGNGASANTASWSPELGEFLVGGDPSLRPAEAVIGLPFVCPPPPFNRFWEAPPWRFIVTRLDCATLTFLDGRAYNRQITYTLNGPSVATMEVPSDDPEINLPDASITSGVPGDPFVAMGNRLLFGFRKEGNCPTLNPWVCRFAGILMQPNDEIAPTVDVPITHITAYDPWQYLYSRPVLTDAGLLPGQGGLKLNGNTTADQVIIELLVNAIVGGPAGGPAGVESCFIDYTSGTIETLDKIGEVGRFRQGMSVGEAWTQIVQAGFGDIVLLPVYDPLNRPGIIAELNIYKLAGVDRNGSIFSWDKPGRSLVGLNRLQDGQQIVNHPQGFAGTAGGPIAVPTSPSSAASIAKYGPYWSLDYATGQGDSLVAVLALEITKLALQNQGKETISMTPAPELSPHPFTEYYLGDRVPVYASRAFRQPIHPTLTSNGWIDTRRIYAIPVLLPDDAPEQIGDLLMASPFNI